MEIFQDVPWMFWAAYFLIINTATFFAFGIDKWKAVNGKWRIQESTLIGMACVGGSIGAFLAMHVFHHKTKKLLFAVGVPMILAVQVVAVFCLKTLMY